MKVGRYVRLSILIGLVVAAMAAVIGTKAAQKNQDHRMIKAMMQKTTTVCVGRLLIDLPANAEISFGTARLGSVIIGVEPGFTPQQANMVIAKRETSLAGKLNEYERPSLEKRIVTDAINFQATLLYSDREKPVTRISNGEPVTTGEEGITVEAFGIKDDLFYRFKGEGLSSPKYEQTVFDLVKKFESRTSISVPSEPGFCLENGFIHDPISPDMNETVVMFASLKGHSDIAIRLDTTVLSKPEESLLSRNANNDMAARFPMNFKSLGKGSRELNGILGEEVLDRVEEQNGTIGHMFMWASPGKGSNVLSPSISLELETGKGRPGSPQNSSLSDEAVLQLWKEISSSLRIRPTNSAKKVGSAHATPAVALGELAATGRICPQTGYWQCSEPGLVGAVQSQFVRQGDTMPQTVVRDMPSFWQRISGNRSLLHVSTVWKLVSYELDPDNESPDNDSGKVG